MNTRVTANAVADLCKDWQEPPELVASARAVRLFGTLAPWWLRDDVLTAAARHNPAYGCYQGRQELPGSPGSCWVVFARRRQLPFLRTAFLLPVRWFPRTRHGPGLPPPLQRLADAVLEQLGAHGVGNGWGLRLHDEAGLDGLDLASLDERDIDVSSAWAALAGGLLLAAEERSPNPHVWASAAWHPEFGINGLDRDSLGDKLDLAGQWEVEALFLPAENQRQALEWARTNRPNLKVLPLMPVASRPRASALLRQYLEHLGVPPPPDAPWESRVRHYKGIDRAAADAYHWTHLLTDIGERCGEDFRERHGECQAKRLITVVSTSPSIVALAAVALRVQRCLLLYEDADDKVKKIVPTLENFLRSCRIEPSSKPIRVGSREAELASIAPLLQEFSAGARAEEIVYDMTPGYKSLSLALNELAPSESWRIYCRHGQLPPDRRVDPGTEHYDAWRGSV